MPVLLALLTLSGPPQGPVDVGPFVRALWLVQSYGTRDASAPKNDQRTKGILAKALGQDGILTASEMKPLMGPEAFKRLAGGDEKLEGAEIERALEAAIPESRTKLLPAVRAHLDSLTTSFDLIDERHREAGEKLARWIVDHYQPGEPLNVVVVCTGNSRRSILGATMGNAAASYCGFPEIRFFSGGTAPTAFNPRTVAALEAIGVEVEPTGKEAPRGEAGTANPIYRVRWGSAAGCEAIEFSKPYSDASNPRGGFAALMVCGEADESCPNVKGAAFRLSMPYLDPKIFDGSPYEPAKYAERRDDLGRLMLSVMVQARAELASRELAAR